MLDSFRKKENDRLETTVIPDSADMEVMAGDGLPLTPQISEIYDMREEISDEKIRADQIIVRQPTSILDTTKTINSDFTDIPKLCDQCYLIDKCPHYAKHNTCYFRNAITIEGPSSLVDLMKMMLEVQGQRVMFGRFIEQSEGGYIDQNLSKEMKLLMELMKDFKEVMAPPKEEVIIKATGVAGSGGGGILSQIFGGGKQG